MAEILGFQRVTWSKVVLFFCLQKYRFKSFHSIYLFSAFTFVRPSLNTLMQKNLLYSNLPNCLVTIHELSPTIRSENWQISNQLVAFFLNSACRSLLRLIILELLLVFPLVQKQKLYNLTSNALVINQKRHHRHHKIVTKLQ